MKLPARLTDWASDAGYTAGWRLVRALPAPLARRAFQFGAELAVRRDGRSVRQLRRNLARVLGSGAGTPLLEQTLRNGMRSYARYWLETFRLPSVDVTATLARVHTDGAHHVDAAVAAGKGAIFALPHSGNWDIAGLWLVRRGYPFSTVAERLHPESLFDKFVAFRESLGMRVLPLTGGPRPPMTVLAERLRAGEVVCLVADRDLSRAGVQVDFFGEQTRMPAGPALLAATTGAQLLPVHLYFDGDDWGQWIGEPIDLGEGNLKAKVQRGTQTLATAFADRIAGHPEDWHMLQRLWLADLDSARAPAKDPARDPARGPASPVEPASGAV